MTMQFAEQIAGWKQKNIKLEALQSKTQSEKDKALADAVKAKQEHEKEIAALKQSLADVTARLDKLLVGSLSFSPSIETWAEAMQACNNDYEKARAKYPDAWKGLFVKQTRR